MSPGVTAQLSRGDRETQDDTVISPGVDSRAGHARIQLKLFRHAHNGRAQYCCKPSTQLVAWSGAARTPAQQAGHAKIQVSTPGDTQEYRFSSPVPSRGHAKIRPYGGVPPKMSYAWNSDLEVGNIYDQRIQRSNKAEGVSQKFL